MTMTIQRQCEILIYFACAVRDEAYLTSLLLEEMDYAVLHCLHYRQHRVIRTEDGALSEFVACDLWDSCSNGHSSNS